LFSILRCVLVVAAWMRGLIWAGELGQGAKVEWPVLLPGGVERWSSCEKEVGSFFRVVCVRVWCWLCVIV
jgi:hypothetical protein